MSPVEFVIGLALLLVGFNFGFYEARQGLQVKDFKEFAKYLYGKLTG